MVSFAGRLEKLWELPRLNADDTQLFYSMAGTIATAGPDAVNRLNAPPLPRENLAEGGYDSHLDKFVISDRLHLMATVVISPAAQKQFSRLPRVIQTRMERIFLRLERWPAVSGAKALQNELAGNYRIRTGDFRIQFRVITGDAKSRPPRPDRIIVEKVGHRDGFYEE